MEAVDMTIIVTEYRREDGLTMQRLAGTKDLWVIRCISGPAWFWDEASAQWVISTSEDFDLKHYARPIDQAMATFETVAPVRL